MEASDTGKMLESEILRLFQLIQKMRRDLSTVCHPAGGGQVLDSAADQLSAIATESENATHNILDASEKITEIARLMGKEIKYSGAQHYFKSMEAESRRIMEACQLHDIIGSRISKIVRTINAVEGTLNSLVVTLGDGGDVTGVTSALAQINKLDGDLELTGPAIGNSGMPQTEIDGLFSNTKKS